MNRRGFCIRYGLEAIRKWQRKYLAFTPCGTALFSKLFTWINKGNLDQSRRVVSSRQFRPRSTISSEARVKAITPTAAKVSPRWLQ